MKRIRDNKGAITLVTLVSVVFLLAFLMSTYLIIKSKAQTQLEATKKITALYDNADEAEEMYNNYFKNEIIPIYTQEQLLAIDGTEKYMEIDGKQYSFSNGASYILMADIEITDGNIWEPLLARNSFTGNFEGNGHTIIQGNVVYSQRNEYGKNFPTVTINVVPTDAVVTINGKQQNSFSAITGTTINWAAERQGYITQENTLQMGQGDIDVNVTLEI